MRKDWGISRMPKAEVTSYSVQKLKDQNTGGHVVNKVRYEISVLKTDHTTV